METEAVSRSFRAWAATLGAAAVWMGLLWMTGRLDDSILSPSREAVAFLLSLSSFFLLLIAAMASWVDTGFSNRWAVLLMLSGVALDLAANGLGADTAGAAWIVNLGLCLIALGAGTVLASRVQALEHVGVIVLVMSVVDLWSVYFPGGWTGRQMERAQQGAPHWLGYFLFLLPVPGQGTVVPVLGVVDIAFVVFFLAVSRRFARSLRLAAMAVFTGLMAAFVASRRLESAVPALPFLGGGYLIAEAKALRLPKPDRRPALLFLTALLVLLAVVSWFKTGNPPVAPGFPPK